MGIKGGEVDKGGLEVGGRSYVLAVPIRLQAEGALQEGRSSEVGHLLDQRVASGGTGKARLVVPTSPVIRPPR